MGHVTLKGPNRLGAADFDRGSVAEKVIAEFAREDGQGGQAAAERVLPARRALWRLAEVYMPQALAASLRARLAPSDQTGRGGVRELRRALADWLDPPPLCAACRRAITDETRLVGCPAKPQRTYSGRGRRPGPTVCAPRRGPAGLRDGASFARDIARCGTLALFTPLQLDPACAAAARLLRHGAAAYDLVVDRDARTLLEVTETGLRHHGAVRPQAGRTVADADRPAAEADMLTNAKRSAHGHLGDVGDEYDATRGTGHQVHSRHVSTPIVAARRHFDRVLNAAIRANGPLILKSQLKQYSPNGSTTRADLVQGAAMGCRRALLDYDPAVARFSTYAVHWMRQGGGEAFAARDLVQVPDWAAGLRRAVEDRDLAPAQLLRLIGTVAETRPSLVAPAVIGRRMPLDVTAIKPTVNDEVGAPSARESEQGGIQRGDVVLHEHHLSTITARRAALHAESAAALAEYAALHLAVVEPARKASKGVAAKPAVTLAPALSVDAVVAGIIKAAALPARAKTDTGDERARERVAAYVAARLGLSAGAKPVTGGALLAGLRHGAAVVVGIGTGEHDDAGGDSDGPGAGRQERLPEHIADLSPDPEEQAAEEDEASREMSALLQALEALRQADPEAAEVVRRRHAMDALGDPETLEEIAAAPLRCTGRSRCREGVRQAYERGKAALRSAAPALLARLPTDVLSEPAAVCVSIEAQTAAPRKRYEPRTRHDGCVPVDHSPRCYELHNWHYSTTPTPEEFGAWAAERDAMAAAF